jgi:hypothetical protein
MFYDWICFVVMLGIAVAYGMQAVASSHGVRGAITQGVVVTLLQLLLACYVLLLHPSIDSLENAQTSVQMSCEGASTLFLIPLLSSDVVAMGESLAFPAFLLAMAAVFIPILTTIYESFFARFINWCARGGGLRKLCSAVLEAIYSTCIPRFAHALRSLILTT